MSNDSPSTSLSPDVSHEAAPLAWLLALLQEAIVGVMAEDTPASKKANAVARLGNLYLKTYHTAELKRGSAELVERVAELEARLTAVEVETAAGAEDAAGQARPEAEGSPAPSQTESPKPSKPRSHGRPHPAKHRPSRPSPRGKAAG